MNTCLYCGKSVKNKYCDYSCQNKHQNPWKIDKKYGKVIDKIGKCEYCNKEFIYQEREKNNKLHRFCNQICACRFSKSKITIITKKGICHCCGKECEVSIHAQGKHASCPLCKRKVFSREKVGKEVSSICKECGNQFTYKANARAERKVCDVCNKKNLIDDRTKKDLFTTRKNWQCARGAIRVHACSVFDRSKKEKKCMVCGYDKYIEICHIKSVSSFSEDSKIKEINDINNLVVLCPNHHWEFDHGHLKLEDYILST